MLSAFMSTNSRRRNFHPDTPASRTAIPTTMRKRTSLAGLAMLLTMTAFSAAQTLTLEVPFSTAMALPTWQQAVSIQQFQPSLGTLDSVGFALSASWQGQYSVSYSNPLEGSSPSVTCLPSVADSLFDLEDAGANLGNEFGIDTVFPTFIADNSDVPGNPAGPTVANDSRWNSRWNGE